MARPKSEMRKWTESVGLSRRAADTLGKRMGGLVHVLAMSEDARLVCAAQHKALGSFPDPKRLPGELGATTRQRFTVRKPITGQIMAERIAEIMERMTGEVCSLEAVAYTKDRYRIVRYGVCGKWSFA